ncbi:MmcQ/YjbR family DNA-binding protein [Leadbetterella byssophila]|uniref:MmcQ/YjbR family DNA-binding protein n=1 Tax=Leadbetterella byssophila TaxID=316068 RepID=UPI00399F28C3
MSSLHDFKSLALSLDGAKEQIHHDKIAFTYRSKIFATLNEKESRSTLKFLPEEQGMLCKVHPTAIFPVPNKWGTYGWAHVLYQEIKPEILLELLKTAYLSVRPNYSFPEE